VRIFDEFVTGASGNHFFSATTFNDVLGRHDALAVQVIADHVGGGTGVINLSVNHSADGRNWLGRYPGGAQISLALTADPVSAMWSDACQGTCIGGGVPTQTGPSLGFVQVELWFSNTGDSAHVQVYATLRDL
jgi:hypothetical protein